ncbi:MAG: DUF4369 domain-containing protein, partial [Bacteroidales bacterium]|nr:DUF4369 domain-containing protein [Bacteroidales bacterium]
MKKLKIILLSFIALVMINSCTNEPAIENQQYTINGVITGAAEGSIFLKFRGDDGWETLDSASLTEGKFMMTGSTPDPRF